MISSILSGRKLILVDAIGAMVSAILLLIPYSFEEVFGMPKGSVSIFISLAAVYCIYSTTVFFIASNNWKIYLLILASLNIGYCMFTMYCIFNYWASITVFGAIYFGVEVLIIMTLAFLELKLVTASRRS
jgi:hypothetical protein